MDRIHRIKTKEEGGTRNDEVKTVGLLFRVPRSSFIVSAS
jgi:hypothetical protein